MSSAVVLRPATAVDAELLLAWRNDPATRAASFHQDPIGLDDHRTWLARCLIDPDCLLLVIEREGTPSGSVRLERQARDIAEIHMTIGSSARGQGLGRKALRQASELAANRLGVSVICARVKVENEQSLGAFRAAGFQKVDESDGVIRLTRRAGSDG